MLRERVHAGTPQNPGSGPLHREPIPDSEMILWQTDDLSRPGGRHLHVENPQPVFWLDAALLRNMVRDQDDALAFDWEPRAKVTWLDGALFTLTIQADNGEWTWRFEEYDRRRDAYRLAWPD